MNSAPDPKRPHAVGRSSGSRLRTWVLASAALLAACACAGGIAWIALPVSSASLLDRPSSAVVLDASGCLLARSVARDGHWRFPISLNAVSPWLVQATVAVEDERFASHVGVDPIAAVRAVWQNVSSMRIRSGASTLTMQLARMSDPRPRTVYAKLVQAFRALQLDRKLDKDAQLACYFNLAPYGGNISGAEAASRLYFSKHAADLSLAQAALLAGLPQSPTRYRPDRHPLRAAARREVVLARMLELGMISIVQFEAARAEPVQVAAPPLANIAPHFADLALSRRATGGQTLLRRDIQTEVTRLAIAHARTLPADADAAVVVIDIASAGLVALVGGTRPDNNLTGRVNGATARRSPGSALKPFIYAAAMDGDLLDANTLVYDIPIDRDGWAPDNFDRVTLGSLPAAQALRRSRNVPAILIAEAIGAGRCAGVLESLGVRSGAGRSDAAGLALATGAVEVSLLDLTNAYAAMGRGGAYAALRIFADDSLVRRPGLTRRSCETLDEILSSTARRPNSSDAGAEIEPSWFMWKTGTSSGRRDAWAVGHNRRYAIGVWIGRLSGGGHVVQVGARAAEPLLTSLFALPALRNDEPPPPIKAWHARKPMPAPPELAAPMQILSPTAGAVYIAAGGSAAVPIRTNRPFETAVWFLNDRLIELTGDPTRIVAAPGRHTLTCRDSRNKTTSVSFTVESPPASGLRMANR